MRWRSLEFDESAASPYRSAASVVGAAATIVGRTIRPATTAVVGRVASAVGCMTSAEETWSKMNIIFATDCNCRLFALQFRVVD